MLPDTLQQLEFDKILVLLRGYAGSPLGEARVLALAPAEDASIPAARLRLAAEAREYLRITRGTDREREGDNAGLLPVSFSGFTDPAEVLAKLGVEGTTLEIPEVVQLLGLAERAADVRRALLAARSRYPRLATEAERIGDFHALLQEFHGKILPSGELDDHASPELRRIRREIEKQRGVILSSLRQFLRAQSDESLSREEIITIRGDRFVVPIRSQRKVHVPGVMHGASSSGQTVYVEPLETIELNNELVRLRDDEAQEIHRILREMTARLREQLDELIEATECVGVLDLAFACGKYALDYDCVIPRFSPASTSRLALRDARHPLLAALFRKKGGAVVPFSLTLEEQDRVLVISGPNTGGKTVALKTVGLLALMAQAGLPVPAADAEFPFFDRVLADIGDYQSIQESLSTFSAHLVNIASMLESATSDSLILLDELGSATDPEEAGALGVAIVDRFRSAGAFTIASTHHLALKAYAMNTGGVRSANMGFDEQTLAPTYRLEVGWPGKSSGLAIAQRLGLPPDVLARAKEALSVAHQEVERFLARLREEEAAATHLRAHAEEQQAALDERERNWNQSVQKREAERAAEWERKLEALWRSFEQRAEEKLRELSLRATLGSKLARAPQPKKEAARVAASVRNEAQREAKEDLRTTLLEHWSGGESEPSSGPPGREPEVGEIVRLKSFGRQGVVRGRSGNWLEVEVGHLRTKVPLDDVAEIIAVAESGKPPAPPKFSIRVERVPQGVEEGSSSEINVIGETADEARRRVDKFLDNAFLSQMTRVRVVHGSGKGILRKALAELFTDHPHVEKFFPAPQDEGGGGATIVELKV
jgi:DNA mismatch repair protein MutS2